MEQFRKSWEAALVLLWTILSTALSGNLFAQSSSAFRHNHPYVDPVKAMTSASSQDTLSLVGQWGWGECAVVVVENNYAFVGNGSLLQVYDVSDPVQPHEVGEVIVPSYISGLVVSGNYAYMVPGFSIIDISDVTHPTLISSISVPGADGALALDGNFAFVGDIYGYVYTIDCSDRSQPVILNRYIHAQDEFVSSIIVVDTVVYVSSFVGMQTLIFDIANISSPIDITPSYSFGYKGPMALQGNHLYLAAGQPYNELLLYDITNRSKPRYINGGYLHAPPVSISIKDTLAFVWENTAGFEVVDIADTSNIFVLAQMPYIFHFPEVEQIGPTNGSFASGIAYVASINGLWLLDVSKLPVVAPVSFMATGGFEVSDITTDTLHHAFIAEPYGGLKILDISNPSSPTLVGHYEPDEAVQDVAVSNNRAYLLCDADLVILDVSNISTPIVVGKVAFGDTLNNNNGLTWLGKLAVFDSSVYALRTSNYLYAINVSNASSPFIRDIRRTIGVPLAIAKSGNYLYVSIGNSGIQVLNASASMHLSQSGTINVSGMGPLSITGGNLFTLSDSGFSGTRLWIR